MANGIDDGGPCWREGDWDDVAAAGRIVADEVVQCLDAGLEEYEPALRTDITEMEWPLQPLPDRQTPAARLLAQRVQLADGVRLVAIEGELVAELGRLIIDASEPGVTFALGYSNGTGLYLPTSKMLSEGGYEVDSYNEYGFEAPLAEGMETILEDALERLRKKEQQS